MGRRVGAFVVVLLVGTAPVAVAACEFMCALRAEPSAPDLGAHSCHSTQHSDAPAVSSGVHVCEHESEMPAAAKTTLAPSYVSLIDAAPFWPTEGTNRLVPRLDALLLIPPASSKLPTPLRI